ncbi:unnamed protein product [Chrysoparadoxa australica]
MLRYRGIAAARHAYQRKSGRATRGVKPHKRIKMCVKCVTGGSTIFRRFLARYSPLALLMYSVSFLSVLLLLGGTDGFMTTPGGALTARAVPAIPGDVSKARYSPAPKLHMAVDVVDASASTLLFAQLAGCGGLLGMGAKITKEREESEGEGVEEGEDKEVDIFRDTAVRYLGYANECGEAFRPVIPEALVLLSYGVAIAYVCADAIAKGWGCARDSKPVYEAEGKTGGGLCALPATFDVLTFQMLASVIFPGFTINRWVAFVGYMEETLHLQDTLPPAVYEYLPTAAGLALIPFIVEPLDNLVEEMLDRSLRPILFKLFPLCELASVFGNELPTGLE